ncbi:MAG: N-acetylmuramoyl-L-alanine amidase [Chloroflexi bacterium]|nr:N-acetylmuramoyl-L-alanine amidase [Chloroflexota bacterium]
MPQLARYIFGIHDPEGAGLMTAAGKPGWVVASVQVSDPAADWSALSIQGIGVIVRLNHGYGSSGTIPSSAEYDSFAASCAAYVAAARGANIWIVGNETNYPFERPGNATGVGGETITPEKYAQCFAKCRAAIRQVAGHADDWVVPAPPALWTNRTTYPANPTGDWVKYFQDILSRCIELQQPPDALALHTYTHGNTPDLVPSEAMMDAPYQNYHYNLRAYRDFLGVVPPSCQSLPVFITESEPVDPTWWQDANTGWVQALYKEIDDWNSNSSNQAVQAVCVSRWKDGDDRRSLADKPGVQADFAAAMQNDYRTRPIAPEPELPPAVSGWCPFATRRPICADNFDVGRNSQPVTAVVIHIAAGPLSAVFPTFNDPNRRASAHFCVGKDGTIEQYVSIADTAYAVGLHYANGHWYNTRGKMVNPAWKGIQPPTNPNQYTVSVEHEGQPEDLWTPQMYDSNNRLLQWIAAQIDLNYAPRETLIGHFEIDPVDRPNCPGPHVQWDKIAADANAAPAADDVMTEIQATAKQVYQLPINPRSLLYQFAQANHLGSPQTSEFQFPVGGDTFVGQVYVSGIVYARQSDPASAAWVAKPDDAAAPSDPAAVAALAAAQRHKWMPVNVNSSFYAFARANDLGDPQTSEFAFTVDGDYVGQVYWGGFVYANKATLDNVQWVRKMDA